VTRVSATQSNGLVFGLDYPSEDGPLHSNISFASGYCYHPTASIAAIELFLNDRYQDVALHGYPRLDVNAGDPTAGERSLRSGFQCFFDAASLVQGLNRFDFRIYAHGEPMRIVRLTSRLETRRVRIADVFVDIVGPCNLKCAMCPQGLLQETRGDRGPGFMPVDVFGRVLTCLRAAGYSGESINLYNWGDPLLHPQIGGILEACQEQHYRPIVSTNLSFPEARVRSLTEHDIDLLLVSISGFSQETYVRNHSGGNFVLIRRNLELLRQKRGRIRAIVIKYLVFRYNHEEVDRARAFADEAGFDFGAYLGAIPSTESFFMYEEDAAYRSAVDAYILPASLTLRSARFCPQSATITINHHAELDRCCVSWGSDARKSVFEADLREHLEQKTNSAVCRRCLTSGYSYYKHFGIIQTDLLRYRISPAVARRTVST
jgi:uncharacterized Fe-S cluster-containing radical SAM superfamily protein